MTERIIFSAILIIALGVLLFSFSKVLAYLRLTKSTFPIRNLGKRLWVMFDIAILQSKILRFPVIGAIHAMVFWGFMVIFFGTVEMVIDGISGADRVLSVFGIAYHVIIAGGDIFALLIAIAIIIFFCRRVFLDIKRFQGIEMKPKSHQDANFALFLIFVLMITLLGMNTGYVALHQRDTICYFPVSNLFAMAIDSWNKEGLELFYTLNWWTHIILILTFANILPYSKHFHVFMAIPNVFLSRLTPLGKLDTMPEITREVKMMMDPNTAFAAPTDVSENVIGRFGVLDCEDSHWKNYLDSLACTQCGRCTSVCPANITGKRLSPRKIFIDLRVRMKEKGPGLRKDKNYSDGKTLIRDYVSPEELWACTTCNACAVECPIHINHPSLIIDMRRYLVMEESSAPQGLNAIFMNIENNGAPWQFSQEDRMLWAEELYMNEVS